LNSDFTKLLGLGRRILLTKTINENVISYSYCSVKEGQFNPNGLNGFGRKISSEGSKIGWFKNDLSHGY